MGSRIRQAALQPEARGQAAFFIRKTGSQQRLPHTILQCHPLPHDGAHLVQRFKTLKPLHKGSPPPKPLCFEPNPQNRC
jgi:hypothetical protein